VIPSETSMQMLSKGNSQFRHRYLGKLRLGKYPAAFAHPPFTKHNVKTSNKLIYCLAKSHRCPFFLCLGVPLKIAVLGCPSIDRHCGHHLWNPRGLIFTLCPSMASHKVADLCGFGAVERSSSLFNRYI